ncbi:ATP-binding protein [uncultured Clostridium sp.]|uniref:ATP-binding protein n=1 Tax=uncultured Clostridium sp. TaxID=59620 RepID=UPI0025FA0ED7|nr:ATP-binding protein [uncultured Clostridium sp.]
MEENKVIARPNKDFFINMLTKDITLNKAIFDLIDNSIDAAIKKDNVLKEKVIKIDVNKDYFKIYDNCGGIDKEIAINYAFNFGRPKEYSIESGEYIGRFGVGMKRCIFKLGNKFIVKTNDGKSRYVIEEDIAKWKDKKEWEFTLKDFNNDNLKPGETVIEVHGLYENIVTEFSTKDSLDKLKREISLYFSMFIMAGLQIELNNKKIEAKDFNIIYKEGVLEPKQTTLNFEGVKCTVLSALAKEPEGANDSPNEAGWYIYSNRRLIVAANKDSMTGWGEEGIHPFHNNYAMFRGFVFFESKDIEKIPLNTTKDGVDEENKIYMLVKEEMKKHMEEQFKFLKKINQTANLKIKGKVRSFESTVLLSRLDKVSYKEKSMINYSDIFPKKTSSEITISFKVQRENFEKVKSELGVTTKEDVGKKVFEYYIDMNEL